MSDGIEEASALQGIGMILWPIYVVLVFVTSILMTLNQKKFRKYLKFDGLFLYMGLYLVNFIFTSFYFRSMPKYLRIGVPTSIMFVCLFMMGRFQIIGLTGTRAAF